MQTKKENYIIFTIAIILLVLVFAISALSFFSSLPSQGQPKFTTPTTFPTQSTADINPSIKPGGGIPPVTYEKSATDRLMEKIENRQSLIESDSATKARLIALLPTGQRYGILYRTENLFIDYTTSADMFQVEILTSDIARAKTEGNLWFLSQGMSQQGICNLPVMYYLNGDIAQSLRGQNVLFSPLSPGC